MVVCCRQRSCGTSWRKGEGFASQAWSHGRLVSLSPLAGSFFYSCCFLKSIPNVEVWRCKLRQTRSTLIPITLYNAWQFFTAWSSHTVPITKCTSFPCLPPPKNCLQSVLPAFASSHFPASVSSFPPVNTDVNEATFVRYFQVHGGQFSRRFRQRTRICF